MYSEGKIWIGKNDDKNVYIYPNMANRHGLIAGATGTGKTITLKVMAESFSDAGVPVFLADAKGDLAGMCRPGQSSEDMIQRMEYFGLAEAGFDFTSYPTNYWDVYGEKGIQLRTTISEMGPLLLARIMGLNDVQTDILNVVFKIADDNELLLIDTKDLKKMLQYVSDNSKEYSMEYGNLPPTSIAAIIRAVVALESNGGEQFFAEPALNIKDWLATDNNGKGFIQVLACERLMQNPKTYSMFLLWMISELYETLPEAGDLEKPRMVFFFDEAHMLFDSASKSLLEKIEQIVKLIRSKGVGVFFITQNPKDIPDGVLSQLGTKIQHALRAYTPAELKSAKAACMSFRENPEFDTFETLTSLGIGEALVSVLDEQGVPTVVKKCNILPPASQIGIIDDATRAQQINSNMLYVKYSESVDRDSAYEFLQRKNIEDEEARAKAAEEAAAEKARLKEEADAAKAAEKAALAEQKAAEKAAEKAALAEQKAQEKAAAAEQKAAQKAIDDRNKAMKSAGKSVASSVTGTLGREAGKALGGTVGGKFGKTLGGNVGASLGRGLVGTLFKLK